MMGPNIFVFTAGNEAAREHVALSIAQPVDERLVEEHFGGPHLQDLKGKSVDGKVYAWGAVPGPQNRRRWESMNPGDYVLCCQSKRYTYCSRVISKHESPAFAEALWGTDPDGETWQLVYFLDTPVPLSVPIEKGAGLLSAGYMGFTRIGDKKIQEIISRFGSVEAFIKREILLAESKSSKPRYWWVNQTYSFPIEREGGFIWAPRTTKKEQEIFHWVNVSKVSVGDRVFHYVKGSLKSISEATSGGFESPRPEGIRERRDEKGWRANLRYQDLDPPIPLEDVAAALAELHLPHGPINRSGRVNQGYLYELSEEAAQVILEQFKDPQPMVRTDLPLNLILYGPPGTGKTYLARHLAVEICSDSPPADDVCAQEAFSSLTDRGRIAFATFHQSYSYEEFVEGIRPTLSVGEQGDGAVSYQCVAGVFKRISQKASQDPGTKYVLVIDEINRGNISKILGELITLLEPDKRHGAAREIRAVLPYSGEPFSVPSNLYIIGTMNTADRSIAFIDTALRRRFEFREILSDPSIVRQNVGEQGILSGLDLAELLRVLNQRIALLYDRDHELGHSYLLEVRTLSELRRIFLTRIIPLLQEYFHDEWSKIASILGCPYEVETGRPLSENRYPLLEVDLLSAEALLHGNGEDVEDKALYRISGAFTEAPEEGLRSFFQSMMSPDHAE